MASCSGAFLKRLTTSKLTMVVSSSICIPLISFANSSESFTKESDLRINGDNILTSSFARMYVGHPIDETVGLRGVPGLCIFGNP